MQSSWSVVCRAMLMIACLVGLPLMALTGAGPLQLVDWVVEWSAARLERASENRSAGAWAATAPPVGPVARWAVGQTAAGSQSSIAGPTQAGAGAGRGSAEAPPVPLAAAQPRPGLGRRLQGDPQPPPPATVIGRPRPPRHLAGGSFSRTEAVHQVEQRLQTLGAVYYLLERWGEDDQIYRFQCRMAIDQDPNHFCSFQAMDQLPLAAMQQVLVQIESWRSRSEAVTDKLLEPAVRVTRKGPPPAVMAARRRLLEP